MDTGEMARLRQGQMELLRLRAEVTRLRQERQAASSQFTDAELSTKARLLAGASKAAEADRAEIERLIKRLNDDMEQKIAAMHAQDPRYLARAMVATNPVAAIEFAKQLKPDDVSPFLDSVFASWARKDTEAALNWVDQQVSDPAEKEADIQAIRSGAPVGIGVQFRQDGDYAVIDRLFPGCPADLGGQLQVGDRIVAVAQGDGAFVDVRGLPLQDLRQMIRGEAGTQLQLQVLPADAPSDASPITVTLVRAQLKFKL
jgi:predicted metalloprotease with PDZ domain